MRINLAEMAQAKQFLSRFGRVDVNFAADSINMMVVAEEGLHLTISFDECSQPLCGVADNRDFNPMNYLPQVSRESDYESFFAQVTA